MNWTCKLVIVLTCAVALTLSSLPVAARLTPSTDSQPAVRHRQAKKSSRTLVRKKTAVAKKGHDKAAPAKLAKKASPKARKAKANHRRRAAAASQALVIKRNCPTKDADEAEDESPAAGEGRALSLVGNAGPGGLAHRITARSAMIMDAVTGETIYAQAADLPAQPASTIKVLTGVISLDALRRDDLVPVSQKAAMMPKAKVYLQPGKRYPANDLINALLLASANDASVALAEKIAGSEQAFARLMTAKAKSFGATNTVCKTASGLTAEGQHTTARDLARIFNNAMRNNAFASRMSVTEVENTDGKVIRSHNRALWQVEGAEGGKTGYTDAARRTYVGKFKRDNEELVVSLMGSDTMWADVKKLVEYGFSVKRHPHNGPATAKSDQRPEAANLVVQLGNHPHHLTRASSL